MLVYMRTNVRHLEGPRSNAHRHLRAPRPAPAGLPVQRDLLPGATIRAVDSRIGPGSRLAFANTFSHRLSVRTPPMNPVPPLDLTTVPLRRLARKMADEICAWSLERETSFTLEGEVGTQTDRLLQLILLFVETNDLRCFQEATTRRLSPDEVQSRTGRAPLPACIFLLRKTREHPSGGLVVIDLAAGEPALKCYPIGIPEPQQEPAAVPREHSGPLPQAPRLTLESSSPVRRFLGRFRRGSSSPALGSKK